MLAEGPTLADRISQGPIPLDEALPIAKQIAKALEAAHEAGVVHRDLKPANIKVRDDGTVKVLDFGLAKALDPAPDVDPSQSPTLTAAATQMGVILGTAAYMSPEQARGKPVDKRADIWAFGAVVFEMLTATKPFPGDDVSQTLARVIDRDPDWDALPATLSPALDTYLRRCLQKDPSQRVRDIGDVRLALAGAFETVVDTRAGPMAASTLRVWQRPAITVGAVLVAFALGGFTVWTLARPEVVPADPMRFVVPRDSVAFDYAFGLRDLAISPDGRQIVYWQAGETVPQLHVWPTDQFAGVPLSGGEGGLGPFVSPDGEWVGFVNLPGTTLSKVSIRGGVSVTLTEFPSTIFGASWGTDDEIVFGSGAGLFRVSASGGDPERLTTADREEGGDYHVWPSVIPGADAVVFVLAGQQPFDGELAVLALDTGTVIRLGVTGFSPHYVQTGHLVYAAQDGSIRAVSFDAASLELTGSPVPLVEDIMVKPTNAANFSVSATGSLVYATGDATALASRVVTVGRDGVVSGPVDEVAGSAWYPRFSPDGSRVAFAITEEPGNAGAADLYVKDLDRGTRTRRTRDENNNRFYPVWSPDGTQLAFAEGSGTSNRILRTPADGSGEYEVLLDIGERQFPMSWAPDGSALAYYRSGSDILNRDLHILPMDGERVPVEFLTTPFEDRGVTFSPDGRWLAYVSGESGRDDIYVRPYPGPGGQVTVSSGGGQEAVWGRDGSELFYRNGNRLMVVAVDTEPGFSADAPTLLFENDFVLDNASGGGGNANYDVSSDGVFVFVEDLGSQDAAPELRLVLNWFEELKARVPVP